MLASCARKRKIVATRGGRRRLPARRRRARFALADPTATSRSVKGDAIALAREVAAELIRYRGENGLSQRALAEVLGVRQPRIVDLESGERNPRIETLIDISRKTGLEFAIDIAPAAQQPKLVTKRMRDGRPAHIHDDVSVVVASNRTP